MDPLNTLVFVFVNAFLNTTSLNISLRVFPWWKSVWFEGDTTGSVTGRWLQKIIPPSAVLIHEQHPQASLSGRFAFCPGLAGRADAGFSCGCPGGRRARCRGCGVGSLFLARGSGCTVLYSSSGAMFPCCSGAISESKYLSSSAPSPRSKSAFLVESL